MSKKMNVCAVIVAAGLSKRLKAGTRKPFLKLGQYSILETAVAKFEKNPGIHSIVVVVHKDDLKKAAGKLAAFKKIRTVIAGGKDRNSSVKKGLSEVLPQEKIVLIHDAARPLVSSSLITKIIGAAQKWGAAIPAVKVTSTVKEAKGNFIEATIDRQNLFLAETPQGFKTNLLIEAMDKNRRVFDITDDASFMEIAGRKVRIVEGESSNIKITTAEDLRLARKLYKNKK